MEKQRKKLQKILRRFSNNSIGDVMAAQTIKTERLTLRAIKKSDAKNIKYLLKPEIENFSGPYMPHNVKQLKQHVDRIRGNTTWGITLNNGSFIGDIGVFSVVENKIGEIAWYIDPAYWNQGYAFESANAVLQHCFESLGFIRISAQISADNYFSRNLAEKLGFELHAILPQANLGGKITDIAYYSLAVKGL